MGENLINLEKAQRILDDEYTNSDRIKQNSMLSTYGREQMLILAQRYIELEQAMTAQRNAVTLEGIKINLGKLASTTAGYRP